MPRVFLKQEEQILALIKHSFPYGNFVIAQFPAVYKGHSIAQYGLLINQNALNRWFKSGERYSLKITDLDQGSHCQIPVIHREAYILIWLLLHLKCICLQLSGASLITRKALESVACLFSLRSNWLASLRMLIQQGCSYVVNTKTKECGT